MPRSSRFEEEPPPVGQGQLLTEAQLRYCLAESVRIDAVRSVLDKREPGSVEEFNQRIADFNGRCGSYRYAREAMFYAQRDVEDNRARLAADARDAYRARVEARKAQRAEAAARQPSKPQPEAVEPAAPTSPPTDHTTEPAARAEMQARESAPPAQPRPEPAAIPPSVADARSQPPAQTIPAPVAQPAAPSVGAPESKPPASATPAKEAPRSQVPSPDPMEELRARGALPGQSAAATPAAEPTAATPAPGGAKPAAAPAASLANDPALARYIREIQKAGTRVLDEAHYPSAASGKGWKGTVQIDVHFAQGGFIRSILLGEGCGHPVLDARALEIARGILFPHRPEALYPREFTVRFPITFKPRKSR